MIEDARKLFDLPADRVWLNCAHQGPLPTPSYEAGLEAMEWKRHPYELTTERFSQTPHELRGLIARLIGASEHDVSVANSNSYGLHLIANGYPWQAGDRVVVMHGDFPSCVLPWMGLKDRGVEVVSARPEGKILTPAELEAHLDDRVRLVCLTWVHSLSGWKHDLQGLGEVCRKHGVRLVVNGSQAVGAAPIDVASLPIDALTSVGFKWLLGPYGNGFLWMRESLREMLRYNKTYWLSMQTADDLGRDAGDPILRDDLDARRYDIFGTANFFNYRPWIASLKLILGWGVENIARHDQALVDQLIAGIDEEQYILTSPRDGAARSTLVFLKPQVGVANDTIQRLTNQKIHVAHRNGSIRIAPHVYNTPQDIARVLDGLRGS